jgi:rhamnulokinase
MAKRYLAIDLGAESGRHVLGTFDGDRLTIEEIHRFPNEPVSTLGTLHWDVLRLWHEVQRGLASTAARYGNTLDGIGVDTWGVDFALLGPKGVLLGNPFHYRDHRTDGIMDEVFAVVPADDIYAATGIQFMQLNTLFQMYAAVRDMPEIVGVAESLLTMPDLLNYWLTGVMATEFTFATTTQMYNPVRRDWARDLLARLNLPAHLLQRIVEPGTILGPLRPELATQAGLKGAAVIAPACHDTGSAVAAIRMSDSTIYLSSGTWSLMGAEVPQPIITSETRRHNFTNEGGVAGTIRLLKNIMGMWLLQGCRRRWAALGQNYDYGTLVGMALSQPVLRSIVEPDNSSFLNPADMPAAIDEFCRRTGQTVPTSPGDYVQTILESLALKYRYVVESLEKVTGLRYTEIRVVGGGARNRTLNQFTADATGCRVIAGPYEATALGNVAMQMVATGAVAGVTEAREVIDRSYATESFEPRERAPWDEAYIRIRQIAGAAASGN